MKRLPLLFFTAFVTTLLPTSSADDNPEFSLEILPLLSDRCFQCHGPDESQRESGLRLDHRDSALQKLDSGERAIIPGDPSHSELIRRITSDDADLKMPPDGSGKTLNSAEIELLNRWIAAGAEWSGHWAFQPPARPQPPAAVSGWLVHNDIDRFIHAQLKQKGLSPEPPASKETLLRRVTLDLTGLPPTIDELNAFLADDSADAYEKVVDRLLDSSHYGEHMARYWLDAARYGDTHGLHLDNERSIWPYRNWVIDAFNRNQPFDQFTVEQLAGDLLPDPSLDQRVATGFNRCNVTTSEGGSIDEEYYVRYAVDRVETTATVWLGLTAGCAACHNHKFDPLTQREFYQLFSYFYSLTERAMDGNALLPPPAVQVPTPGQQQKKQMLQQQLTRVQTELQKALAEYEYTDPAPDAPLGELEERDVVWIDDELPEGAVAQGNGPNPFQFVEGPDHPVHSGKKSTTRTGSGGEITQHFFTGAKNKLKIDANTRLFAYCFLDPDNPPQTLQLQFNDGSWNHRATWGADKAFLAGRNDALNRQMGPLPETGQWVRLEVSAEAVGLKPGAELNGWAFTQVDGTVHWDTAGIVTASLSDDQKRSLHAWELFQKSGKGSAVPDDIKKIIAIVADQRTPAQQTQLTHYFLQHVHPDASAALSPLLTRQQKLSAELAQLEKQIPSTLVMQDRPQKRQAHVLERGEYTLKREPVQSAVPAWLAPPVPNAPDNRLGLALWLVQKDHPLTARVTVNRFWQQLFGIGIVRTAEDFGLQGELPSHPLLLDWLATDFVDSGWDVKRCLKQMVMSATYRQSSRVSPDKQRIDPENRLLARGPRFRLDAEVIRDQALAVSGLLIDTIGGRSVKPYQPPGIWEPVGFGGSNTAKFVQDSGEALYRRSMYTFWKRTAPPPAMTTFDAPNRETCRVRRARTNTPLQALVLMNDVQFVEAARRFAERVVLHSAADNRSRIIFAYQTLLTRTPTESEIKAALELYSDAVRQYSENPDAAAKLLSIGESVTNPALDQTELAAWTLVTHLMLNLSETVTRG